MTNLRCVVCGAETDAYLDVVCTNRLERHLAELPSLFAELTVTETRQGRTYRAGGRSEREPEPTYDPEADVEPRLRSSGGRIALRGFALPYDEAASVLRDECWAVAVSWANHLVERADVPEDRRPTNANMLVWLVAHVDAVRMDEAAAEMVDEIEDVHKRLTRAVDNSPARTFWGRCDAVEDEGDEACGRDLYAKDKAEAIVCDGHRGDGVGCGAVKAVDDVRAKLREFTAGALVTIAEVHGAAHRLFPDRTEHELPSRRIMDGWTKGESPRIKSPQRNPANEPLFRGEELLRLVEGYRPHKSRRSRYAA